MEGFTAAHVFSLAGIVGMLAIGIATLFRRRTAPAKSARPATKRVRLVRTFTAHDSRGRAVSLSLYHHYRDAGTRDNPAAERLIASYIFTPDGRRVDKFATRKYRVAGSSDILTADEADAA